MDIHSLIKYFRSIPPASEVMGEPYTEEKSTFVMKKMQNPNDLPLVQPKPQALGSRLTSN